MFGLGKRENSWRRTVSSVVRGIADAACLVDHELAMIEYNRAFLLISGHRPKTLDAFLAEGNTAFDALCEAPGHDKELAMNVVKSGKQVHDPWVRLKNSRGNHFDVMRTLLPVADDENATAGVLCIYRDVSAESAFSSCTIASTR